MDNLSLCLDCLASTCGDSLAVMLYDKFVIGIKEVMRNTVIRSKSKTFYEAVQLARIFKVTENFRSLTSVGNVYSRLDGYT